MCGITGYWAREGPPDAWLRDLPGAVRSLRQRGPDDSGTWARAGGSVAFGHARLSILDLSPLGHQPMRSEDGDLVMVFNGEIYNFAAIRSELEGLGHRFRGSGDSEVLLAALRQWGMAAVGRLIGMFAIALWSESERRLWLIRDRLGVKPLYYAWDGRTFWFGSELKALRAFGAWRAEIDSAALGEYFQFGYVSAPRSIYRQVSKLLPGHWLELGERGEPVTHCYWSALEPREALAAPEGELEEQLEALFIDAFRYRMVSDVPVGVFLSGGLDSSLVAAILARHSGQTVHTFTVGFSDPRFDESPWARRVAEHLGTRHTEHRLDPAEMARILPRWADLFDEPFGDPSGVPTFLVSRVARESVKVALSADGGDELFSGYQHYDAMLSRERMIARVPLPARHALSQALRLLPAQSLQGLADHFPAPASLRHAARRGILDRLEKARGLLPGVDPALLYELGQSSWMPAESARLLGAAVTPRPLLNGHPRSFADYMTCCDLRHYLPDDILTKVDRTTMAVGLEGREPLLDHRLVEFALRLPLALRRGPLGTKHLLRRVLYRYVPRTLLDRPKQGFAIPMSRWLRGELSGLLDTHLAPERIRAAGILDPDMVARALRNFRDGGPRQDRLDTQKLWLLLAFEMWREKWA
ncbi:MAG TPA: asparagine synthase (glutamine-hydrolyzing) [Burkholderiales bacterium]|nr:asparagine synthase (glutamine-hydrolyzing) [Burkholderiales bacterium]